ncbi:hypothetical protein [Thalassotalea euphylliae]|uniref:Uncharacterized protein n=1 Tax=Thalassotalea euphylliae TaxID=1655234 RepID=A0A3E0UAT8_9GAMM|nr:hypothetical protein [Thalassotalea euphylliae]REL34046.1 hypothetical protein DXX92_01030 [Thalassotalea euphylliae]
MILLGMLKNYIDSNWPSKSSMMVAIAAATVCSDRYGVSLLTLSTDLDREGKKLVFFLMNATDLPDFNASSRAKMFDYLMQDHLLGRVRKGDVNDAHSRQIQRTLRMKSE